jgi:hypothetical protein
MAFLLPFFFSGELMKKCFTIFALCLSAFAFSSPIQNRCIDPSSLQELTATLGISPDKDLIAETQKQWLRSSGKERWEMAELTPEKRKFVLDWAKKQGLYSEWSPLYKTYDKALILGATTSRMQMRLDYLKTLWNQGSRFSKIIWLTGDRPLDKRADELTDRCSTETEAARVIWEKTNLPDEMRKLPVVFVSVPMKGKERPNTADTIVAWLNVEPNPCTALFVSDQPFCGYQHAVIKGSLPEPFQFEVVGPGVDPSSHPSAAAITLDALARWLYQDNLNKR